MKLHKDMFEIIFFARAGQGAKSAAEILAQSAMLDGKFIQAFSQYGPERSGAPTRAYVRISARPIRIHEPITDPDAVVVFDETLLASEDVAKNLDRDEWLIVNSGKTAEELKAKIPAFLGKIHVLDANRISSDVVGRPQPNAVMLGKIIKISEIVKIETVKNQFKNMFLNKVGLDMTEKNILAMERGYDSL